MKKYEYYEYKIYLTPSEQKQLEKYMKEKRIDSFSKYLKEKVKGMLKNGNNTRI